MKQIIIRGNSVGEFYSSEHLGVFSSMRVLFVGAAAFCAAFEVSWTSCIRVIVLYYLYV